MNIAPRRAAADPGESSVSQAVRYVDFVFELTDPADNPRPVNTLKRRVGLVVSGSHSAPTDVEAHGSAVCGKSSCTMFGLRRCASVARYSGP